MAHKFDPKNMQKLDNSWRRENLPPSQTLDILGLGTNDIFGDIGCGNGYFTLVAAKKLDLNLVVYAFDTSEVMLAALRERAKENNITQVKTILTDEYDLKIPDGTLTMGLMTNVLHEIDDKDRFIKEVYRCLTHDGRIAIIEWDKTQTESGPPINHRISREDVIELLEDNFFEIVSDHSFANTFYGIVARK